MEKGPIESNGESQGMIVADRWSSGEVQKYLHRSRTTVRRLVRDGLLHPMPGPMADNGLGHEMLFDPEEVKAFAKEGGMEEYEAINAPRSAEGEKARAVTDIVGQNTEHTEKSWAFALDTMKEMRLMVKESNGALRETLKTVNEIAEEAHKAKREADTALLEIKEHLYNKEIARAESEKKIGETKLLQSSAALFAKSLIARLVGGKEAADEAVTSLVGTLTTEQQAAIFPHLNSDQLGALMILIEGRDAGAKQAAEEEQAKTPAAAEAPAEKNGSHPPAQPWFSGLSFGAFEAE
jgi:hypothetical protein